MSRSTLLFALFVSLLAGQPAPEASKPTAGAKPDAKDPWQAGTFASFRLRAIGPALMSGRIVCIAVHPRHKSTWYVAVASGGVWKTTNAGTTWTPVFQNEGSYSVGQVVIDAKNPETVWVGSGESNNQRSVGFGDGVYRSDDGGKTWRNVGLRKSEHIGRIVIDPRDSNVVYVAAVGPLWSAGGDRGLYKTVDGGKSWKKILEISENTGVTDVAVDPANPDVVLAAAHQRRRHVWSQIHGGPESALYRSTDAGASFAKVRITGGEIGRIGFAFSAAQRGLVYARVEASDGNGGFFASLDAGVSWEKRDAYAGLPMYYANVHPDPNVAERVYFMDVLARVTNDGGRTWGIVGERSKHVDNHYYWIDPADSDHILNGCDGGMYESWDRGKLWRHVTNLSVTQFYNVDVDNASPVYNVYGGTQDNNTLGGPSRTRGAGATNADWFVVTGGDGFVARIDPTDPNIVYAESQYGVIVRLNRRTSERVNIKPVEGKGEAALRFNWESPFIISPHAPARLYFGANRLFRSDDRGSNWRAVSGDLTRQIDRDKLPIMGKIWPPEALLKHASTSTYGNITAVSESRKKEGVIWAGTDDGNVQVTDDGGKAWRKSDGFPGLPETSPYGVAVQRLAASKHDANTVYALFDNHKNGDYKPYVFKSTDLGKTWTSVAGDLPAMGMALGFAEDHVNPNLLFVGTEFGLYFTVDGGKKWIRLRTNLPTIPVRDLAIQERENDLVLATFGRGFYVLDDYSALRAVSAAGFDKAAELFSVKKATMYVPETGKRRGSQGEQLWMAENPPYGAQFTYWLKDGLRTAKQQRTEKRDATDYPTPAQLTAEVDEEAPQILLTISDAAGKVVKRMTGPTGRGIHRVTWNLRGPAVSAIVRQSPLAGTGNSGDDDDSGGAYVAPGTYKVALAKRVAGVTTPLGAEASFVVEADPALVIRPEERRLREEFITQVSELQRRVAGTLESANGARTEVMAMRRALLDSPADVKLLDTVAEIERRLTAILRKLRGDETLRGLESGSPASVMSRAQSAGQGLRTGTGAPTGTQRMNYQIALEELGAEGSKLRTALEDLKKLKGQLDAAGVPYTAGRYQ